MCDFLAVSGKGAKTWSTRAGLTANGSCQAAAAALCLLCTAPKQSWAGQVTSDQTRQPEGGKERKQHTEAEWLSAPEQY